MISADGVECDPAKVEAVKAWKPPHNVRFVRSFLGTVGYYRRFIKSFAEIAKPLFDLLKKNRRFVWTDACQRAFRTLQQKLVTAPVMAYPQDEGQFILDTDASAYAIGGVLSQVQTGKDGQPAERVIAYASRTMQARETRYCARRREFCQAFPPIFVGTQSDYTN